MKESEKKFRRGEPIYLLFLVNTTPELEREINLVVEKAIITPNNYKHKILEIENMEGFDRWVIPPEDQLGFKP